MARSRSALTAHCSRFSVPGSRFTVHCSLFTLLAVGTAAAQSPDSARSTRAGVYTAAQAARGSNLYALTCASCHTPATHAGPAFAAKWEGHSLSDLFEFVSAAMPKNDPGSLTRREYILVLAYLLKMNDMPAGPAELPTDSLALTKIRIDLKPKADPAPER